MKNILLISVLWLTALVAQAGTTKITYYVNDALGSPVVAMNEAGAVTWRKTYAPYGKTSEKDGDNRVGYTGHVEDPNGLVYAGARYYDPALGIFASDDPVRFNENNPMSFGRYTYANNNPYKFADPNGKDSVVVNGNINILPVANGVPSVTIPNTVGAIGVSSSDTFFHEYSFSTSSGLNLSQAGDGIKNNPTPGVDAPASAAGSVNDAGFIPPSAAHNVVKSFSVASPDPSKYSDITVNYTVHGLHTLDEGFVMRYGEIGADGKTTLRTYGEGNAFKQDNPIAKAYAGRIWSQNNQEINDAAK